MVDIIQRKVGHNNESMLAYCNTLKDILMQTKQVKSGRGKSVEFKRVLKYKDDIETLNRIIKSCEHYKKLNDMDKKFPFREYQKDIITKGSEILKKNRFLYLAMEVRTGKTLTSLGIAEQIGVAEVLFITKKKAISSIEADYSALSPSYSLTVINYESLHLVMSNKKWDLIICDEAHSMGAFPKPSQRAGLVAKVIGWCKPMVILLSGTPTPESYSQMYHQVYGIPNNPFREFTNFYRFCDNYVKVKDTKINGLLIRDYSEGL